MNDLDDAMNALVGMRPADIVAAERKLQAMLHLPLSPSAVLKLPQLRAAAMQSAHHWYMCSSIRHDVTGYSNDGLWTPPACTPEVSVKG